MELITGHTGSDHVTSDQQAAVQQGTYGDDVNILDYGGQVTLTAGSGFSVNVSNGVAIMYGRAVWCDATTFQIDPCASGRHRLDAIVIRYKKDEDQIETASWAVVKGTETTGTPTVPMINVGGSTVDGVYTREGEIGIVRVSDTGVTIYRGSEILRLKNMLALAGDITSLGMDIDSIQTQIGNVKFKQLTISSGTQKDLTFASSTRASIETYSLTPRLQGAWTIYEGTAGQSTIKEIAAAADIEVTSPSSGKIRIKNSGSASMVVQMTIYGGDVTWS